MRTVVVTSRGVRPQVEYWLKNLQSWRSVVDKVYVVVSGNDIFDLPFTPKVEVISGTGLPYPENLSYALQKIEGDTFIIMHDDVFVYNDQLVRKMFETAKVGRVVCPRQCTYSPIEEVKQKLITMFGEDNYLFKEIEGEGVEYSILPYFLAISRANLEIADYDFGRWKDGHMSGDFGFYLQLRLLEAGVQIIPMKRNSLTDYFDHPDQLSTVSPDYFHIESMSYMFDEFFAPTITSFFDREITSREKTAIEMRLAWMSEFLEVYYDKFLASRLDYGVEKLKLSQENINHYKNIYKSWSITDRVMDFNGINGD